MSPIQLRTLCFSLALLSLPLLASAQSPDGIILAPHDTHSTGCLPAGPRVAITFDDGPSANTTPQVLRYLAEYGVSATFFLVGNRVGANKSIVQAAFAAGHDLAVHTWGHANLTKLTPEQASLQLQRGRDAILAAVPEANIKYWRAPYGAIPAVMRNTANTLGMKHVAWGVDPLDWSPKHRAQVTEYILGATHEKSIILLHDIHQSTVEQVPFILDGLIKKGYIVTSVSKLEWPTCDLPSLHAGTDIHTPMEHVENLEIL